MKLGICHLYKREEKLCESHIYPKFMFDSLKWSNKTKFVMEGQKCPMQGGYKIPFLCQQAENKFSNYEKWFKTKVYTPFRSGKTPCVVKYDSTLFKFMVMQIWRSFEERMSNTTVNDYHDYELYEELKIALEEWRLFLADDIFPSKYNRFYLMPVSCINISMPIYSEMALYIRRNFDLNILMCDDGNKVVWCKFPSFYIWTPFKRINNDRFGFRISLNGGEINLADFKVSDYEIIDYIHCKICDFARKRNEDAILRSDYIKKLQQRMILDKEFQDSELAEILQLPQIPYLDTDIMTII